jgi:hypothetical protein
LAEGSDRRASSSLLRVRERGGDGPGSCQGCRHEGRSVACTPGIGVEDTGLEEFQATWKPSSLS